jgi:hypothetical protein
MHVHMKCKYVRVLYQKMAHELLETPAWKKTTRKSYPLQFEHTISMLSQFSQSEKTRERLVAN